MAFVCAGGALSFLVWAVARRFAVCASDAFSHAYHSPTFRACEAAYGPYSASGGDVRMLRRVVVCWRRYCGGYSARVVRLLRTLSWCDSVTVRRVRVRWR